MFTILKGALKLIVYKICACTLDVVLLNLKTVIKSLGSKNPERKTVIATSSSKNPERKIVIATSSSKNPERKIVTASSSSKSWIGKLSIKEKKSVLTFLNNQDLISLLRFEPAYQEAVTEPLRLAGCYDTKDEDLLCLFQNGFPCQTLDLNHCYWFGTAAINQLLGVKHLRNLHLIECKIDEDSIGQILRLKLNALSISWNNNWGEILSKNCDVNDRCFKNLKELTVFHGANEDYANFVYKFKTQMLIYCNQLRYLKVYECPSQRNSDFEPIYSSNLNIDCAETTPVPKLTHLIIHLYRYGICQKRINFLVSVIFSKKTTPIEELDLGENGFYALLENYAFNQELQFLKPLAESVCFSRPPLKKHKATNDYISKIKPKLFEFEEDEGWANKHLEINPPHLKFKKFVMKNACVNNFQTVADVIADSSDQMEHLDLRGLYVTDFQRRYQHFENGFQKITLCFPQLTYLDLTMNKFCLFAVETNLFTLRAITNFTALKTLKLPSLIFCELLHCDNQRKAQEFKNISVAAMRKSPLWDITIKCKNIEKLHIVSNYYCSYLYCPEYTFACIGNLKKLKELHLVNVPTLGMNFSLQIITTQCPLLKKFYMKNLYVGRKPYDSKLLERAIFHMKNVEDLCIYQALNLSSTLIDQLCHLPQLKRLMIEKCVATPEVFNHFSDALLKMEKLIAFCLMHSPKIRAIEYFRTNLKRLKSERTAFSHLISSRKTSDKSRNNATLSWPAFHEPLRRYSKVQVNTD